MVAAEPFHPFQEDWEVDPREEGQVKFLAVQVARPVADEDDAEGDLRGAHVAATGRGEGPVDGLTVRFPPTVGSDRIDQICSEVSRIPHHKLAE